ncbi:hypothetical protein J2S03_000776 [Alicyclobacillus cycloheptanicus]|uniref:DUF4405 domain-containing protein n=1 Tax=Alicyclobacillus cycloheptanicus TaxID=1457 RepID=A0ABT9XF97_9BACL|nr:hypothetical protein [Alicyclobacillus cycloheptanicus]
MTYGEIHIAQLEDMCKFALAFSVLHVMIHLNHVIRLAPRWEGMTWMTERLAPCTFSST